MHTFCTPNVLLNLQLKVATKATFRHSQVGGIYGETKLFSFQNCSNEVV